MKPKREGEREGKMEGEGEGKREGEGKKEEEGEGEISPGCQKPPIPISNRAVTLPLRARP